MENMSPCALASSRAKFKPFPSTAVSDVSLYADGAKRGAIYFRPAVSEVTLVPISSGDVITVLPAIKRDHPDRRARRFPFANGK